MNTPIDVAVNAAMVAVEEKQRLHKISERLAHIRSFYADAIKTTPEVAHIMTSKELKWSITRLKELELKESDFDEYFDYAKDLRQTIYFELQSLFFARSVEEKLITKPVGTVITWDI